MAGLGLVLLAALAVTGRPLVAAVLLLVLVAVPVLLVSPRASAATLAAFEAGNVAGVAGGLGVPAVHLLILGLCTATVGLAVVRGRLRPCWSPVLLAGLVLLAAQAAAAVAAEDPVTSLPVVLETARGLVFLLVLLLLLVADPRAPRAAAMAFVLTLAALSALTAVQEFVLGNSTEFFGLANVPVGADVGGATARHAGPQQDVNFWGRVLVLGLPLALSLAVGGVWRRLLWLSAALSVVVGVYLTGSRGALLAVAVTVAAWALLAGRRYARLLLLSPLVLALALAVPGLGSRLTTLSAFSTSSVEAGDPSLQGRVAAQQVGLEIVREHPVLGVGPGNFTLVEPTYLRELGLDSVVLAPHNLYLEAAAEGGLVGFAAWLLLLLVAGFVAARALALSPGRTGDRVLTVGVLASLVGWAVVSVFLHVATFRSLLVVVALGAALDVHARQRLWAGQDREPAVAEPGTGPAVRVAVLLLVLGVLAYVPVQRLVREPAWQATAQAELSLADVQPSDDLDQDTRRPGPYEQSILSRDSLLRTYATVATQEGFQVAARSGAPRPADAPVRLSISPPSTVITLTSTHRDRDVAVTAVEAVRDALVAQVNRENRIYVLASLEGPSAVEPSRLVVPERLRVLAGVVGLVLLGVAAWSLVTRRRTARR